MRHLVFALLMALLLSSSAVGAGQSVNAFITNLGSSSVSVVDTATNGFSAVNIGTTTQGVAMDPKGTRAYVVSGGSPSSVYAIDTKTKEPAGSVPLAATATSPAGIAVSPDGTRLYVAHAVIPSSGRPRGAVSVIYVSSTGVLSLGGTMTVYGKATGVAVSPSAVSPFGDRVYVANTQGRVSVVDPAQIGDPAATAVNVFVPGSAFIGVAVSPDGARLYAADAASNTLRVIDTTVIGTLADPVIASVNVGASPFGVAISPNGKRIFVTNVQSDDVTVIDPALIRIAQNPVIATTSLRNGAPCVLPPCVGPHGVAVTSDSAKAYVVNQVNNTLSALDGTDGRLLATATVTLPNGSLPIGFGTFLTPLQLIPVMINFVPGAINLKKQGTVPVIMYGSDGTNPEFPKFDVHTVELSTVCFNRWGVKEKPNGERMANFGDFNGDGLDDVMVHIAMDHVDENCAQYPEASLSNPVATLVGESSAGHFQGLDDKVKFVH